MSKAVYPVHENFHSWQGEGVHLGRAAYFIRLLGCPVKCPWCDSAGTWHPDYLPKPAARESAETLAERAARTRPSFVVLTGGEPAIHPLAPLAEALRARGLPVHLETSGAFPIRGAFDWTTLSPKRAALPLAENLRMASELKLIVEAPDDIEWWMRTLRRLAGRLPASQPIWLHPEWSKRGDPEVLKAIVERVKRDGDPFRAGYQTHKLYGADQLDPRSRLPVPLGGNPELGY